MPHININTQRKGHMPKRRTPKGRYHVSCHLCRRAAPLDELFFCIPCGTFLCDGCMRGLVRCRCTDSQTPRTTGKCKVLTFQHRRKTRADLSQAYLSRMTREEAVLRNTPHA